MSVSRILSVEEFRIRRPLYTINVNAAAHTGDIRSIGFIGSYSNGLDILYTGIFRDSTDAVFKLFQNLSIKPDTVNGIINSNHSSFQYGSLAIQDLHTIGNAYVDGTMVVTGDITITNIDTLQVEDNIITANIGGNVIREDGGFIINRPVSAIIGDVPKITGTASAMGTTTTIVLAIGSRLSNDYYLGWAIKLEGDVTGEGYVTHSSTDNPTIITFSAPASGPTTPSTVYKLFNKHYVGSIWDESEKKLVSYGFPRQGTYGVIDNNGFNGDGNLADCLDTRAMDSYIDRDLYVGKNIKNNVRFDDNIITANAPSTMNPSIADGGFVIKRSLENIIANDIPKIKNIAIHVNYIRNSTTIIIKSTIPTDGYFVGWVVTYNNANDAAIILSSTYIIGGIHTLVLSKGFTIDLFAGSDVLNLYNKKYAGYIWDESAQNIKLLGFPRENNENLIDIENPVNGNIPDYLNLVVNDIEIKGSIALTNSILQTSFKQIESTIFSVEAILRAGIIYLSPTANSTYELPLISNINIASNRTKVIIFVNISNSTAIIQANALNTIVGRSKIILRKMYSKTTLIVSPQTPETWMLF